MDNSEEGLVLTPILATSKIPILAMIMGYCYQKLPPSTIPPLLSTLVRLIEHNDPLEDQTELIKLYFPSLKEILSLIDTSITSFYTETSSKDLKEAKSDVKIIHRYLLEVLWNITSLDMFHDFIASVNKLLIDYQPGHKKSDKRVHPAKMLTSTSFLGRFVYNIAIAFEVLVFDETVELWNTFLKYREETRTLWHELGGESALRSKSTPETPWQNQVLKNSGLLDHMPESFRPQVISQIDLAQMLEQQVQIMQRYSPPPPQSIKLILKLLSGSQRGLIPSAYYIEYLECWKQSDYEGSFNALHRYFDYMMSNKQQLFYHYALLSLATLHASFNSDEEALRAIDEAILVARENKDLDCLNYLLAWLFNFLKDRPHLYSKMENNTTRDQILQFLKIKTKENRNWILQSMTFQYHALQYTLDGGPLHKILENITRASYILLNFEIGANIRSTFVRNCQLTAATWNRVGVPALTKVYTKVALDACGPNLSIFDDLAIGMRRAVLEFENGEVDAALEMIKAYEKTVVNDISLMKIWQSRYLLLQTDLWLKKCRYKPVSVLLDRLQSQVDDINDQDVYYELQLRKAQYEHKVGNHDTAVTIATDCIARTGIDEHAYNHYWYIEFRIFYALVLAESSSSPERAMSILLDSLSMARKSSLITLTVKGFIVLCELILKIDPTGSAGDAEDILVKLMPLALQVGSLWMSSYGYYLLARVLMIKTTIATYTDGTKKKDDFNKILEYLETSITGFKKMNDLMMMRRAFCVEKELATFSKYEELSAHSETSIAQIDTRIQEEKTYSVC
ncbi:hypothetical protein OGAPHI_000351 [Ogataea philodendri]|uniref:Anaphase-promoting complex subunit 5 n=1 Tax=Ogataea philodendri TaxID=1378263 RepID=A0A9P8TB12_9ASCO|nr:uncharacterized protein OGAPHI_000351 [Ogataea philodendri]KAH3671646.1 hypothetical protein OGAPHI_000351 [Ogataea philodendri]